MYLTWRKYCSINYTVKLHDVYIEYINFSKQVFFHTKRLSKQKIHPYPLHPYISLWWWHISAIRFSPLPPKQASSSVGAFRVVPKRITLCLSWRPVKLVDLTWIFPSFQGVPWPILDGVRVVQQKNTIFLRGSNSTPTGRCTSWYTVLFLFNVVFLYDKSSDPQVTFHEILLLRQKKACKPMGLFKSALVIRWWSEPGAMDWPFARTL